LTDTLLQETGCFRTDDKKVRAILTHLINNAIKFSRKGTIEFGCKLVDGNKMGTIDGVLMKPAELEFFVKDTGTGIPENRHQAIFERFVHADIEDKAATQGSGLGLSIAKAYVELLGGKIGLESSVGLGSTFYFSIPV
jgi:signal transduction histidine kinase